MVLEEALELRGDEIVLDFGCGSGRISYWVAPKVNRVLGLEVTPEMIDLAERNRTSENVEFILYDGIHFPVLSSLSDLVLSVGVLQTMGVESLKETVSQLMGYLKSGGKMVFIEQASDNRRVGRPKLQEYLHAFEDLRMKLLRHYPIRRGRWWFLYLIRYGIIPRVLFPKIAKHEIHCLRNRKSHISYYRDYLFVLWKS